LLKGIAAFFVGWLWADGVYVSLVIVEAGYFDTWLVIVVSMVSLFYTTVVGIPVYVLFRLFGSSSWQSYIGWAGAASVPFLMHCLLNDEVMYFAGTLIVAPVYGLIGYRIVEVTPRR